MPASEPEAELLRLPLDEHAHDLVQAFVELGADYVVVGAYALAAHCASAPNGRVEVLLRPSPENAMRVVRALAVLDVDLDQYGITHYDFAHPGTVFELGEPAVPIVLVTSISGLDFDEAWSSRAQGLVGHDRLWLLGRDALAKHLRAAGRATDAAMLEAGAQGPA